ncbi:ABC transporter substrate-binding protein [Streptomyces sp. GC420]|uniref:ABC transporter substrate-binding protein n=1 Tax=Streptomyces sp. GC420 TaxID=2697568 RepID=UPI001414DB11|nr:ABC transporter substrate-binding protein [Streptomyces sp. GC420]NBM18878.1 ABC transporter substrate-binding protein [Streptomyces sp. GC420]
MTGRRRSSSPRALGTAALTAAVTAVCTSLISGCGVIPGTSGDSDDPVVVMTWAPEGTEATNMPGMPAMAKTYAQWINSKGGINGRPLKVLTCNDHNDSISAGTCAREAVKENVVAVVGSYSQHGRSFFAPLEAAGIPYIGGYGISEQEFSSPFSFPVNGGQAALLAGNGIQLAGECEKVSLVRPDTVSGDTLQRILNAGLTSGKAQKASDIRAAEDATDYTGTARTALESAGSTPVGEDGSSADTAGSADSASVSGKGCVTAALGERTETFFDSYRRLLGDADSVRFSSVLGSVDQSLVDRTGGGSGPLEGAFFTGWYPVASDPRWDPMRKVIRDFAFKDNRIDPGDAGVQTTWIAYTALTQVVEHLGNGEITARSVTSALNKGLTVDTGGLTPELNWSYENALGVQDLPRAINADVTFQVVRGGRLVSARKGFVDVGKTLESVPVA